MLPVRPSCQLPGFSRHVSSTALVACLLFSLSHQVVQAERKPLDAAITAGTESCRDCHEPIVEKHETSVHARSFMTLLMKDKTRQMAEKIGMDLSQIATDASCVRCHFTQETLFGAVETTEAISCESCHGEATPWIDHHHRKSLDRNSRVHQSVEKGMHHPANLAPLADSCFQCHIIDDEKLVNQGGHPALSEDFELLSAYLGEVNHRFLTNDGGSGVKSQSKSPQPVPQARQRMLFLSGKLLHLSHSLCAIGCSQDAPVDRQGKLVRREDGSPSYAVQHAIAIQKLLREMRQICARIDLPEFSQSITLVDSIPMSTGHQAELEEASIRVRKLADELCERTDGSEFAAIDSLLKTAGKPIESTAFLEKAGVPPPEDSDF